PNESRVDLLAIESGVAHVRVREVELLDRIDPLEVFTVLDGSVVAAGQLVASVKVAPRVVPAAGGERGSAIESGGRGAPCWVAPVGRAVGPDGGRRAGQGVAPGRRPRTVRAERPGEGGVAGLDGRPVRVCRRRGGGRRGSARVDDDRPEGRCRRRGADRRRAL